MEEKSGHTLVGTDPTERKTCSSNDLAVALFINAPVRNPNVYQEMNGQKVVISSMQDICLGVKREQIMINLENSILSKGQTQRSVTSYDEFQEQKYESIKIECR